MERCALITDAETGQGVRAYLESRRVSSDTPAVPKFGMKWDYRGGTIDVASGEVIHIIEAIPAVIADIQRLFGRRVRVVPVPAAGGTPLKRKTFEEFTRRRN